MLLKYCGGRPHYKISRARRPFIFNPENDFTLDLNMDDINYILRESDRRNDFKVIEREIKEPLQEVGTIKKEAFSTKKGK